MCQEEISKPIVYFYIFTIKSSYQVDRALFNFLFNSFENSLIGHSLFWS